MRELNTALDDPGFMTSQTAAPPGAEDCAAPESTTTWQAAVFSPTQPIPSASGPPETPVSTPRTTSEQSTEAEAGACMGTAPTTRKRAQAKNAFKQLSSNSRPAETARGGTITGVI